MLRRECSGPGSEVRTEFQACLHGAQKARSNVATLCEQAILCLDGYERLEAGELLQGAVRVFASLGAY